jgi:hypothetical protein
VASRGLTGRPAGRIAGEGLQEAETVFQSLDFVYLPARDFEAILRHYVKDLGGELIWRVRGMGTIVAHVQLSPEPPGLLLAEHLDDQPPILVYRVENLRSAMRKLRSKGVEGTSFEIPHGPVFRFDAAGGQRLAVYQLTRPEAGTIWAGRLDP